MEPVKQAITGKMLSAQIRVATKQSGLTLKDFAAPLSSSPLSWIYQLERAERPNSTTIAKVRALIAGQLRDSQTVQSRPTEPPVGINREPCFLCGVRADHHETLGCKQWIGV